MKKAITRPVTISPEEAKISLAIPGKAEPIMGDQIATPSHNRMKKVVPKMAPIMLPMPPTISIPSHQIESIKG